MKMAKKLLAVVLAGVLALSVLTGCGNAASTKTIADVLSDMSKGQEIVYKADSKLNGKAKELGEYAVKFAKDHEDEGEGFDYSGELNKGIMADVMKDYKDKFVYIAETETKGYNATAQAYTLLEALYGGDDDGNINSAVVGKGKKPANVRYIGTATIEVEGETWRIAVVTADAEEVKKPEKN